MMGVEERIRFLLEVAKRAEGDGEIRVARAFRRRAEEARPWDLRRLVPAHPPPAGCCVE